MSELPWTFDQLITELMSSARGTCHLLYVTATHEAEKRFTPSHLQLVDFQNALHQKSEELIQELHGTTQQVLLKRLGDLINKIDSMQTTLRQWERHFNPRPPSTVTAQFQHPLAGYNIGQPAQPTLTPTPVQPVFKRADNADPIVEKITLEWMPLLLGSQYENLTQDEYSRFFWMLHDAIKGRLSKGEAAAKIFESLKGKFPF